MADSTYVDSSTVYDKLSAGPPCEFAADRDTSTGVLTPKVIVTTGGGGTTPIPVGVRGAMTDRSGTITLGATAQNAAPVNATRNYLLFQNTSDTDMWVNVAGTAAVGAGVLCAASQNAGVIYDGNFIPTNALSVYCATTGKTFTCQEG